MLMAAAPTTVSMVIVSLPHLKGRNYGAIAAGRFDLGQTVEAVAPASCEARLLRRLHGGNLEGVKLVVVVIADRDIFARNEDMGAEAIAGFVVEQVSRVAVRDPGRQLLERDVGQPVQGVRRGQVVALLKLEHPAALEQDRIDVAGHGQVVAQHDRVAAWVAVRDRRTSHHNVRLRPLARDVLSRRRQRHR